MEFHRSALMIASLLAATALPAHSAGAVEVSFIEPARYSDAGKDPVDEQRNEEMLARYLQTLGERYLAPAQTLKVDVLDVDLAGTMKPFRRSVEDVRIVRGSADFPRIKVRYSLVEGGKVVQNGEETVTDLNYLRHGADYRDSDPLRYEKRMLSDWFKTRFVELKPAG